MSEDPYKSDLLPCPFCGASAFIYHDMRRIKSKKIWCKIGCKYDCVTMPPRHDMWFTSEDEAANAWNRRVK